MIKKTHIALALIGVATLAQGSAALAADYSPPIFVEEAAEEYKPVEIGSGWYLRGDVGYDFSNTYDRMERSGEYGVDTKPFSGSVGMGYHFNDYFRGELNAGILPSADFIREDAIASCVGDERVLRTDDDGNELIVLEEAYRNCAQTSEVSLKAYDIMANAFVDLGTYAGITPYVGAGVGAMYVKSSRSEGDKNCVTDQYFICRADPIFYDGVTETQSKIEFAYALGAGLSYRVAKSASIDLGYEFKSAPGATYYVVNEDTEVVREKGLDFHTVKLGFRYDLW